MKKDVLACLVLRRSLDVHQGGPQRALEALPAARLARVQAVLLDHIVSVPAVVEPVAAFAALAKRLAPHALVIVDGAHAWGQLPGLHLPQLGKPTQGT